MKKLHPGQQVLLICGICFFYALIEILIIENRTGIQSIDVFHRLSIIGKICTVIAGLAVPAIVVYWIITKLKKK